jgi:hypothetical protein
VTTTLLPTSEAVPITMRLLALAMALIKRRSTYRTSIHVNAIDEISSASLFQMYSAGHPFALKNKAMGYLAVSLGLLRTQASTSASGIAGFDAQ